VRAISILSNAFLQAHPEDAARVVERLPPKDQARLLANAPAGAGKVMARMAPPTAATCLALMNGERALHIVRELSLDFRLSLLRCMQDHDRERLLQALGPEEGEPLRTLLRYPDNTAGALMDPYLLSVPDDITAGEALRRMRSSHRPVLYYLYVLDREHRLVGVTTLRELMRARPSYALSSVMRKESALARVSCVARSGRARTFSRGNPSRDLAPCRAGGSAELTQGRYRRYTPGSGRALLDRARQHDTRGGARKGKPI